MVPFFVYKFVLRVYSDCRCSRRCCFFPCSSANRSNQLHLFLPHSPLSLSLARARAHAHTHTHICSCSLDIFQVVKQRMQTGQFSSPPAAVRLIVAKEGFKGLYAVWKLISFQASFLRFNLKCQSHRFAMQSCLGKKRRL